MDDLIQLAELARVTVDLYEKEGYCVTVTGDGVENTFWDQSLENAIGRARSWTQNPTYKPLYQ